VLSPTAMPVMRERWTASSAVRPVGAVQPTARGALPDPREDVRRQRLRETGGASRGPPDGEPVEACGLRGVEPALQRAPADPQALGDLAMAPPTSGHEDRLATVAPPAVGSDVKGVVQPSTFVFAYLDGDQRCTLPDESWGG
jgi:hypothetical protein